MNLFLDSAFCFTDLFVLILVPHCLDYCSFGFSLEVVKDAFPNFSFFHRMVLGVLDPLHFI